MQALQAQPPLLAACLGKVAVAAVVEPEALVVQVVQVVVVLEVVAAVLAVALTQQALVA